MSTIDEFIAEVRLENKQLKAGIREGLDAMRSFEKTSQASFEKFAKDAEASFKRFSDSVESLSLQNIQQKLDGLATAGQDALASFIGSAAKVEQFRLTLETLTGSASAAEAELQRLVKFSAATPFQLEDVVAAGVTLRSFKADVEQFLPLAGDLASVFGRNIKDSARALGKALSGSQDGIQILNDSFGIARRDLKDAGATMKSTGAISLDTAEDIQALAKAIQTVADQKNFTGAIEKQLKSISGNVSQLQDASFRLAAAIGDSLSGTFIALVQPATNLVNTLTQAPPVLLGMVAGLTALGTAAAVTGSAVISLGVAVSALRPFFASAKKEAIEAAIAFKAAAAGSAEASTGMRAAAVAAKGFGAALAASVIAAGALFFLNQYEQSAIRAGKAIDEVGDATTSTFHSFRVFKTAIASATDSTEDFIDAGKGADQVVYDLGRALEDVDSLNLVEGLAQAGLSLKDLSQGYELATDRRKRFTKELQAAQIELQRLEQLQSDQANQSGGRLGPLADYSSAISQQKQVISNLQKIVGFTRASEKAQKQVLDKTKDTADVFERIGLVAEGQLFDLSIKADTDNLERSNSLLEDTNRRVEFIRDSFASIGKEFKTIEDVQDAFAATASPELKAQLENFLKLLKEQEKLQKQTDRLQEAADSKKLKSILLEAEGIEIAKDRLAFLQKAANDEKLVQSQRQRLLKEIQQTQREIATEEKREYKERINQAIFEAQAVEGGAQKKIDALRQVLEAYKVEKDQRRQVLRAIDRAEAELAAERKKRREDEAEGYQNEVFRQQELLIEQIDERIDKLRQEAEEGKNTTEQIVQALKERGQLEIDLIEARTEARKRDAKSEQVRAEIEKTGQLEIEAARRKVEKAIKDQRAAQKNRIKDIRDERDAAVGALKDEKDAREDLAGSTSQQDQQQQQAPFQDNGTGPLVKGAPGQTIEEMAKFFSRFDPTQSTGPQTGQSQLSDAERKQLFRDLNPGVLERGESQDAANQQQIADEARAQQEELAAKAREKQEQILDELRKTREENLANQRVQQAQSELLSTPKDSPEYAAAQEKYRQALEQFQQVQQANRLPTQQPESIGDKINQAQEERDKKAKIEDQKTTEKNINIVVEFDDKGQKVIKSVTPKTGIDGAQTQVDRTLQGFNLKVNA